MSRLLIALAAALVLAASALAAGPPVQADLEAEIVCPTCKTTLDQSNAPIAVRMKTYIRDRIAAGDSSAEIKSQLVDQFGPGVLAEPPKRGFDLLAWLLPLGAVAVGAVVVGALAVTWSKRRNATDDASVDDLDPELEQRLDEELDRFEA
ncbi:cytochrome c-type biogenesis protein CcmH [Gaiella sp.]|uniref:cytochrome c-type biogenesis protein n=1 Tax=Gaiella sp. TaxID=2663207 RepID=UPI0032645746